MTNPIEQRLASGMSAIAAFLTDATCGESCWEAREDVCRCCCGGKNHGCMRTKDGVQPQRTSKIDGYRYRLVAVAVPNTRGISEQAEAINRAAPKRTIGTYSYFWSDTDRGAPARLKAANDGQIARWPELTAYRCGSWPEWKAAHPRAALIDWPLYRNRPYLLWVREDVQIQGQA